MSLSARETVSAAVSGPRNRLVRELTIPTLVVAALVLVASTLGALELLADAFTDSPIVYLGIAAPALTGAWMTVELCWTRRGEPFLPRFGFRLFALGGIFILVNTIVHGVVTWEPARLAAERFPDQNSGHFSAWIQTFFAFDLLGAAATLGGGVAGLLLVTLPYFVVARPREYADANMLAPGVGNLKAARVSGLAMVIALNLVFAVPALVVFGTQYHHQSMVVIGWALIPVGIVAVIVAAVVQRPDRARRKAAGLRR
ncbi:hypothetical protein GCM10022239_18190 [Leifsonia bigeumensis]|uniref:Uncharacterized protein n=1 Tax=Leifsonella bigeumensis TaxID=433643 RepID=A0ABP7FPC4_9MICO